MAAAAAAATAGASSRFPPGRCLTRRLSPYQSDGGALAARAGFDFHSLRKNARRVRRCGPLARAHLPAIFRRGWGGGGRGLSKEHVKTRKLHFFFSATRFPP